MKGQKLSTTGKINGWIEDNIHKLSKSKNVKQREKDLEFYTKVAEKMLTERRYKMRVKKL